MRSINSAHRYRLVNLVYTRVLAEYELLPASGEIELKQYRQWWLAIVHNWEAAQKEVLIEILREQRGRVCSKTQALKLLADALGMSIRSVERRLKRRPVPRLKVNGTKV